MVSFGPNWKWYSNPLRLDPRVPQPSFENGWLTDLLDGYLHDCGKREESQGVGGGATEIETRHYSVAAKDGPKTPAAGQARAPLVPCTH